MEAISGAVGVISRESFVGNSVIPAISPGGEMPCLIENHPNFHTNRSFTEP